MATCKYVRKTNTIRKATRRRKIDMTALLSYWKDAIKADPSLLSSAVEHGVRALGYEYIKPEQLKSSERSQCVYERANWFREVPGVSSAAILCRAPTEIRSLCVYEAYRGSRLTAAVAYQARLQL